MAVDPLERARAQLLRKTAVLLDELDPADLPGSFDRISPRLHRALFTARKSSLDAILSTIADHLARAIGVDLGWDFLDQSIWIGAKAKAQYAARLAAAGQGIVGQLAAGRDPLEVQGWVRYWQLQIAGSEVHQVARDATIEVAGNSPALGRVMRIAEPGACNWCLTMASRGPVYHSEATALSVSHGHCRCEIRTVTDPAVIADIKTAGAEAWQQSPLAGSTDPFRSHGTSTRPRFDADLTKVGAITPERLVAVRTQIATYTQALESTENAWMTARLTELTTEEHELVRALAALPMSL